MKFLELNHCVKKRGFPANCEDFDNEDDAIHFLKAETGWYINILSAHLLMMQCSVRHKLHELWQDDSEKRELINDEISSLEDLENDYKELFKQLEELDRDVFKREPLPWEID